MNIYPTKVNFFKVFTNIPKTYLIQYSSSLKKTGHQTIKQNTLFHFNKTKVFIRQARLNFLQFFFIRCNPTKLNNYISSFKSFDGGSIEKFFNQTISFLIGKSFSSFFIINNIKSTNYWMLYKPGDFIKQPLQLKYLSTRLRFSKFYLNKMQFLLTKHIFLPNTIEKKSFKFFFKKFRVNINKRSSPINFINDQRTNTLVVTYLTTNKSYLNSMLNWENFRMYNWKYKV